MSPAPKLSHQTVLITGAANGLGRALALAFSRAGSRLLLVDIDQAALATLAANLPNTSTYPADLSDATSIGRMLADVQADHTTVDTLIHNAGYLVPTPFVDTSPELWRRTFNVGIEAAYLLTSAFWSSWQTTGAAALYVSSRSGIEGFPNEAPYCATKHAIEGLVKSLALEGAPSGIFLHAITPGAPLRTPMSERNYTEDLKRTWVDPLDLTPAFLYLATRPDPALSGQRLSASDLSRENPTPS